MRGKAGSAASSVNRLGYGAMVDDVIACRRDDCRMVAHCPYSNDDRPVYGGQCPAERTFVDKYVEYFMSALAPGSSLSADEITPLARRLALLECRRDRLAFRLRRAWESPPVLRDDIRSPFYKELGLIGRYMTAIDNEMAAVWEAAFGPENDRA